MPLPNNGRPTVCEIDHDSLRWNFRQIRAATGPRVKILAMIKANAYGHGAVPVGKTLAAEGSDAFGVATVEEAVELRRSGITEPILVLAGTYAEQLDLFLEYKLTPVVHDSQTLVDLDLGTSRRSATLDVHLKVDTGMGRIGFLPSETASWLPDVLNLKALRVTGVFSHFSQAENVESRYTRNQLAVFREMAEQLCDRSAARPVVHLANSAATITQPDAHFDMVRPGLILYGVYPGPEMSARIQLKPALSWKTRILQLKKVPRGTSISYGQTFVTRRESLIATLPVGYADGYPRLLSNSGVALVGGKRAPVAGRVCMDLTMIDVTDIRGVRKGDEAVLLGQQGDERITADDIAAWANTISYEILTSIGSRVPRIHHNP